jgi:PsbP-like protein
MSSLKTTSSASNSSVVSYQTKSALGITIKYPLNWKAIMADEKALIFLPPSKRDNFSENLVVALFNINSSVGANQLSDQAIKNYGGRYNDFFIIELKPITFQGEPAYVLSYSYTNLMGAKIVAMDIGIKDQNEAYVISYSAEQPEYHTYIPMVEKMIHSFHVI